MEDNVIMAEVDGEGMIIDVERCTSHFLNETALLIYKMAREGKTTQDIKDALLAEYEVDEQEAEKDITEFLDLLESKVASWGRKNI